MRRDQCGPFPTPISLIPPVFSPDIVHPYDKIPKTNSLKRGNVYFGSQFSAMSAPGCLALLLWGWEGSSMSWQRRGKEGRGVLIHPNSITSFIKSYSRVPTFFKLRTKPSTKEIWGALKIQIGPATTNKDLYRSSYMESVKS